MEKRSNFKWYLYESKMLWKGILNLDICSPWSEAVFTLNRMKMVISDSEQPHSSNGLFFSLTCKQPLRHTALGSVVRKPISANPKFLYPQTLFNADILQNFRLEEVKPEKQKPAKETFNQKLKNWNPSLR